MCWQKQRAAHSQKGQTPGLELERKFPTSCHSLDGKPRSAREKEGGRGGKKKQCSWKRTCWPHPGITTTTISCLKTLLKTLLCHLCKCLGVDGHDWHVLYMYFDQSSWLLK